MERMQVSSKNPFFQHARMEAYVCYRDQKPVGRIAAIKDDLHNSYCQDQVGFFGFFEAVDDQAVVERLISAAQHWLHRQGCAVMRGPVNPSMKSEFGVLIEGHHIPPTIMMAHSPARYDRHLLEADFQVAKTFYAFHYDVKKMHGLPNPKWDELYDAAAKIQQRYPQLTFRHVEAGNYAETLRGINELGNQVRSEGWGFVPLTSAELEFMIKNLKPVIRFDMIHVAYWHDQLVGYIVNIPDVNWALQRTWGRWDWLRLLQLPFLIPHSRRTRVIALGVDPKLRTKGVAMLLIKQLVDRHVEFDDWEFSWVLEDNLKSIRAIGRVFQLDRYKTYRLYERAIPEPVD